MKERIFIIALLMVSSICQAQTLEPLYSIDLNRIITIKKNRIDPFVSGDVEFQNYASTENVIVGNSIYSIKTAFDKYTDSRRGFNVISLCKGGKDLLTLKSCDAWTYTYGGPSSTNYQKYTNNKHFIAIDLSNNSKALFFIGWPYGGDLPILSIIVLTENDAKLVYNKNVAIVTIDVADNQHLIKIQTALEEYDSSGKLLTSPNYAYLVLENEILKVK